MKIVSICGDKNISVGLRLVGVEGFVVQKSSDFDRVFKEVINDRKVGIVVVGKEYASRAGEIRSAEAVPMIVVI